MEGSSLPLARGSEYLGQGDLKWWGLSFVSGVHETAANSQTRRQALAIRKLQAPGQCRVLAEWLALQRCVGSDSCPRALHRKCAVCQKRCYRAAPFSLIKRAHLLSVTLILYWGSSISNISFYKVSESRGRSFFLFRKKTRLFFFIGKGSAGKRWQFSASVLPGPFSAKISALETSSSSEIYIHLKDIKWGNLWHCHYSSII